MKSSKLPWNALKRVEIHPKYKGVMDIDDENGIVAAATWFPFRKRVIAVVVTITTTWYHVDADKTDPVKVGVVTVVPETISASNPFVGSWYSDNVGVEYMVMRELVDREPVKYTQRQTVMGSANADVVDVAKTYDVACTVADPGVAFVRLME